MHGLLETKPTVKASAFRVWFFAGRSLQLNMLGKGEALLQQPRVSSQIVGAKAQRHQNMTALSHSVLGRLMETSRTRPQCLEIATWHSYLGTI